MSFGGAQVAAGGERQLVAAHPVVGSERKQKPAHGNEHRRDYSNRGRQQRPEEQIGAVGADGGGGEEAELAGGKTEGELVLELDIGWHLDR